MRIAVIGAGAAGCFAAINIKKMMAGAEVMVYEGGTKALAKVAMTGGGRCNLTNTFSEVTSLSSVYPRGERLMKRLLREFDQHDTCQWFEDAGVRLMTQTDQRIFPKSENALEIVDKLLDLTRQYAIVLKTGHKVKSVIKNDNGFELTFVSDRIKPVLVDKVVIAIGGCRREEMLDMVKDFRLDIVKPVPSLFSFCIPEPDLLRLTGISVAHAGVSVCGTKLKSEGGLLITHRGISGPAVLRLSSYAARYLAECNYETSVAINWMGDHSEEEVRRTVDETAGVHRLKQLQSVPLKPFNLRLWQYLLCKAGLRPDMRWCDVGKKGKNKIVAVLINDTYKIKGKNQFKDEFVTCGGVSLANIAMKTLECRMCEGLYFAGEVLDVDAVTGGFNLQAAWTMGYVVAKNIARH